MAARISATSTRATVSLTTGNVDRVCGERRDAFQQERPEGHERNPGVGQNVVPDPASLW